MNENIPELDDLDREILNRIQVEVPLVPRPFKALADDFGISEHEMISRVQRMWDEGVVRRLGPIVDYHAWNMSGVLVAARVSEDNIDRAKEAVANYPEITHAYLRDHDWNLWFTVIAENDEAMDAVIGRVSERAGLKDVKKLLQDKSFKLGVKFEL
jgi:DNA-binding Lrp family transcriptional regulator